MRSLGKRCGMTVVWDEGHGIQKTKNVARQYRAVVSFRSRAGLVRIQTLRRALGVRYHLVSTIRCRPRASSGISSLSLAAAITVRLVRVESGGGGLAGPSPCIEHHSCQPSFLGNPTQGWPGV